MQAPTKRPYASDQVSSKVQGEALPGRRGGDGREGDEGRASSNAGTQPVIQRPDGSEPPPLSAEPPPPEGDVPDPTTNPILKPIERPDDEQ